MSSNEYLPSKSTDSSIEESGVKPRNLCEILVVDDEPTLRMGFRIALGSEGYQVKEAPDGETAVTLIRSRTTPYDAIVLDLRMPGMDGLEVADFLAKEGIFQPILILSAHLTADLAVRAMGSGVADFLTKPVRPNELRSAVARILAEEKSFLEGQQLGDDDASLRFLTRRRDFDTAIDLAKKDSSPWWRMLLAQLASNRPNVSLGSPAFYESADLLRELTSQD